MLTQDDGVGRRKSRGAVHVLLLHRVKLLEFRSLPFRPIGETTELATSEAAETLLCCRAVSGRIQRADKKLCMIVVEVFKRGTRLDRGNGPKLINRYL